jgi:hypothetical protein
MPTIFANKSQKMWSCGKNGLACVVRARHELVE